MQPPESAATPLTVAALAEQLGAGLIELVGDATAIVHEATIDSRTAGPGTLFCCLPGDRHDGHDFAAQAAANGASALLVERVLPVALPQLVVDDARQRTGFAAAVLAGRPADRLNLIGVTGTNGKTTVASLVSSALDALGRKCAVIGTLSGSFTTPEAPELQRRLAGFVAEGYTHVVMEVSSHGLALGRVAGCRFAVAAFTNLSQDHLDFHPTMEDYFAAKALLFRAETSARGVIDTDDGWGARLAGDVEIPVTAVRAAALSDVHAALDRVSFTWRGHRVEVPLGGSFNVTNAHLAAEVLVALGVAEADAARALGAARAVPGRFEVVDAGQRFTVIVDFAHTPEGLDALGAALAGAGARSSGGRTVAVFGAGGDRDRAKRPRMGAAVARWADVVVVTSDNPRSEAPEAIIDDVVEGIPEGYGGLVMVVPDRREAFAAAFAVAQPGDVVVIAGRGHERRQQVATGWREFHDPTVAAEELEKLT